MDIPERRRRWYASLPKTALVAYALVTDPQDRVLLVQPTYKDCWLFPGGVAEAGEDPAQAARRELREELGVDLAPRGLLAADSDLAFEEPEWPLLVVTVDFGTPHLGHLVLAEGEIAAAQWFTADDAAHALCEYDRPRLTAALAARRAPG